MPRKRTSGTPEERFWQYVDASGDCWEWTGYIKENGYGQFWPKRGEPAYPHRFAWELLVGSIPLGMVLDHLCKNKRCVNPDHLEVVTQRENHRRGRGLQVLLRRIAREHVERVA